MVVHVLALCLSFPSPGLIGGRGSPGSPTGNSFSKILRSVLGLSVCYVRVAFSGPIVALMPQVAAYPKNCVLCIDGWNALFVIIFHFDALVTNIQKYCVVSQS